MTERNKYNSVRGEREQSNYDSQNRDNEQMNVGNRLDPISEGIAPEKRNGMDPSERECGRMAD
jgi:hypothetical protein